MDIDFYVWLAIQKTRNKNLVNLLSNDNSFETFFLDCWNTAQNIYKQNLSGYMYLFDELQISNLELLAFDYEELKYEFEKLQDDCEELQAINETLKSRICFLEEQLKDRNI